MSATTYHKGVFNNIEDAQKAKQELSKTFKGRNHPAIRQGYNGKGNYL